MVPFVLEVFDLMNEIVLEAGMWSALHGTTGHMVVAIFVMRLSTD